MVVEVAADYRVELYSERNIVERLTRRLKGFRRGFSRYGKLGIMYPGCVTPACISEASIRPAQCQQALDSKGRPGAGDQAAPGQFRRSLGTGL